MDKNLIEAKIAGKEVSSIDVAKGSLTVIFKDGSILAREKNCDGEIMIVYYNPEGEAEASIKIWG